MSPDTISVYAGKGSSHSWTWLADLFESRGVFNARFEGMDEFIGSLDSRVGAAIISGGDGLNIASSLSGRGFRRLQEYIDNGGLYVGICAGAYLPLPSAVAPFSEFNLSTTKIENIDCRLDQVDSLPPRVAVRYGRCAVVHPVRGELELSHEKGVLRAPLYGGPIFKEPEKDKVLLRYTRFTDDTEFQFNRRSVFSMVLSRPALVESTHGSGRMLLFGPHLEHPRYPEANELFMNLLSLERSAEASQSGESSNRSLSSALADLKVAILGLENRTFVVGKKMWDGSRYLELVRAIEKRAWSMDERLAEETTLALRWVRGEVIRMNVGLESDADETTLLLVEAARRCVDNHFQMLARGRQVYTTPA